ncbi:protein translocase subunit SecD [Leifsonia sp. Root112D2]|uniref:protein translocase subunit SecD n=1 Tax=Leifsonia sp. Root112D2 TaxID=1736426 RepID=UPI0006F5B1AE|nr:protein translocase subunit SecD [Leifsonia sp. Root112D2]KQV08027.1 preprotein translocase subunit SecD [Leifsonia sp. Root112D2]
MAKSSPVKKAWRSLIWLGAIIVVLAGVLASGVLFGGASWAPKLGLDLEGGTEIILAPQLENGKTVTSDELAQSVSIIRKRVDASGVSEAQISTQGNSNVVVSIPGPLDDATKQRIESSSKLDFRAVLLTGAPTNAVVGADGKSTPAPSPAPGLSSTPTAKPTNGSDLSYVTPELQAQYNAYDCKAEANTIKSAPPENKPLIACDDANTVKYLLGPVEVHGSDITNATAGLQPTQSGVTTGEWGVNITFNGTGGPQFNKISSRLIALDPPRNQFAAVLDGAVITAPRVQGVTDQPTITGNFNQESATSLANELKFGALPVSFKVQSSNTISATLGSSQLQSGLIAGIIGLLLVMVYTLFQYRLLGFVTIASLVGAFLLTYLVIAILAWRIDYRLSLAGVAGIIVSIGFTADSFIVYFERIRDELRDGRGLESAVEAGWRRAKRTIYASKSTNLLAAVVLYVLAVGSVQGFAFTLGVMTIIDVLIVILFTHPTLQLLAQTRFFASGHSWSGLDPEALGALYRGGAQFRAPSAGVSAAKLASSSREAAKRQTIAERKAAELEAAKPDSGSADSGGTRPKASSGSRKGEGKDS